MKIYIASTNPVKVNSVRIAASETWPDIEVRGIATHSGVPEQPVGDDVTRQGAENRARAMLKIAKEEDIKADFLGVGLEGGVFINDKDEMWSTVWAVVIDLEENIFYSNGARFLVPDKIAQQIKLGREMGPTVAQIIGEDNVKQKQGMIGVVTDNFIDRTEEYTGIVKLVLGLWYGRGWQNDL